MYMTSVVFNSFWFMKKTVRRKFCVILHLTYFLSSSKGGWDDVFCAPALRGQDGRTRNEVIRYRTNLLLFRPDLDPTRPNR
jgi:hypothetical protein